MIKNLIKIALRHFLKDKAYSVLNVLGLTTGITFSLLLVFYVLDELSYDSHHAKNERIFRVGAFVQEKDTFSQFSVTQNLLAPTLKNEFPEVEEASRLLNAGERMFENAGRKYYENKFYFADSTFFKIFTHRFLEGDPATALTRPFSIILTKSLAIKYFGRDQPALGKTLLSGSGKVFNITGVVEDVPKNSHITFNGLVSFSTIPKNEDEGWGSFGAYTYVLLNKNSSGEQFEHRLKPLYDKYMAPIFAQFQIKIRYVVQNITDIHLRSKMDEEPEELGSMSYIYIFSTAAMFMLLIACINYMNLTTARSARRAKEIGIRKVAGSSQKLLVAQFLTESIITTIISTILSLGLLYFLIPSFNSLSGKHLTFLTVFQPESLIVLFAVLILVGFLGGSYPAFYLSKFNPVAVLKGSLSKSSSNAVLRRVLMITQFSISIVMIICTSVVYSQLNYLRDKDLGFNKDHLLILNIRGQENQSRIRSFMEEIKSHPAVRSVSSANNTPGGENLGFNLYSVQGENGVVDKGINNYAIDKNYLATLGIKIIKGRNFVGGSDTAKSAIVNESFARSFGWKEPLGKRIKFPGDTSGAYVEVVGIVQDFHQKSLYNPIAPLILFYSETLNTLQIKIAPEEAQKTLAGLENTWKKIFQGLPFEYSFLDQKYNSQYTADEKRGKIFTIFSILTILITCLGLLGLIAFTTQQRQKEISIRKVVGAGQLRIMSLLASNFVALVLISCFIAFPIAWFFMNKWLKIFTYHEEIHVSVFVMSAIIVILITMITIGYHTLRAAWSNPVKSLRTE
jgi:putative ABC transport system permease protein